MKDLKSKVKLKDLKQKQIKELFEYCHETGALLWKERACSRFNSRFQGKHAGTLDNGRMRVSVDGKMYYSSRVVYIMFNGAIPKGKKIDHVNKNRLDDRVQNLRSVTDSQNSCNRAGSSVTGMKGVTKFKGQFMARITKNGVVKYLGLFPTVKQAGLAYDKAAKILHGKYAYLNFA